MAAAAPFEDEFLNDFDNDDGEDDDDEGGAGGYMSGSESENGQQLTTTTAENGMEEVETEDQVEVAEGSSDLPKHPLRLDAEFQSLLSQISASITSSEEGATNVKVEEMISKCNKAINKVTVEMQLWHRRACRLYNPIFPELEKLVPEPIDFARVILAYGDNDEADLSGVLPSATVMVVKVSKSAHINSLQMMKDKTSLQEAFYASNQVLSLDNDRTRLLSYVEAQMKSYAPNLYDLIGSRASALLIGLAGGLEKLARIPSNDIQVMGRKRSVRADTGIVHGTNAALHRHAGVLYDCPLITSAPPHLRRKTLRVVAGRVALAARVDETKRDFKSGKIWREEIEKKIELWQDPGPGKAKKALPVPDAARPKRRGGRRARKLKEKLGLTSMRTLANREKFGEGTGDVEYSVSAMGQDLGMLTKSSNGRVRAVQTKDTQKLGQAASKKLRAINAGGGGNNLSGFSSLAFTPVQGMELAPSSSSSSFASTVAAAAAANQASKPSRPAVPLFSSSSSSVTQKKQ